MTTLPLRRFVVLGQKATTDATFSLDDVPGTTGRLDVLLRALPAALLVSHGLRRDTVVYLVLYNNGEGAPRTVRIDGRTASYLRPDERAMAGRIRAMLGTDAEGCAFGSERQGMAIADGGLDSVLADLTGEETLYVLDEAGDDVRGRSIDRVHPVFFVGDHLGFDPGVRARLDAEGAKAVRVGPISLHADQAIVLMQSELDRGA